MESLKPILRFPEILLSSFDGDFWYWPIFQDKFSSLIDSRTNLSTIDKFYYLIGYLEDVATDIICSISVSTGTNGLAWTTLSNALTVHE